MAWLGINGPVLDIEVYRTVRRRGLMMLTVKMMRERGLREAVQAAVQRVAADVDAVYLTIDIDVVSAAEAPGTGAPVFSGLTAIEFLEMMDLLSGYDIIRAVDLCEVSPPLDAAGTTSDLAVTGLLNLLQRRLFERVELDP
jgi:arginase family enzyme